MELGSVTQNICFDFVIIEFELLIEEHKKGNGICVERSCAFAFALRLIKNACYLMIPRGRITAGFEKHLYLLRIDDIMKV